MFDLLVNQTIGNVDILVKFQTKVLDNLNPPVSWPPLGNAKANMVE